MVTASRTTSSTATRGTRSLWRTSLQLPSPSLGILPSFLLLLLSLLTATNYDDSAAWRLLVAAQGDSPFKGQGIAPTLEVVNGKLTPKQGNASQVPVYMSILFDKLEDVDGEWHWTIV